MISPLWIGIPRGSSPRSIRLQVEALLMSSGRCAVCMGGCQAWPVCSYRNWVRAYTRGVYEQLRTGKLNAVPESFEEWQRSRHQTKERTA